MSTNLSRSRWGLVGIKGQRWAVSRPWAFVRVALPCAAFNSSLCLLPQKLEYTMGDSSDMPSRKELTSEELCKQMDKLLKENPNNQRIYDWIEVRVGTQCLSV